jgi:hypothetical protein
MSLSALLFAATGLVVDLLIGYSSTTTARRHAMKREIV